MSESKFVIMKKQKTSSQQSTLFPSRKIPQMPEGYYSSGPNPNLRKFVDEHATPYDPEIDNYNVKPFDKPITTTKANAIYNMHTYWSKKPHDAIREYIKHYTQPEDLVLDPFCGSGGTALAALMEGRVAIAIDLSPAATFITKNYSSAIDIEKCKQEYIKIKEKVISRHGHLYTTIDRFGNVARIGYTTWSERVLCEKCLEVYLLAEPDLDPDGKSFVKAREFCPFCSETLSSSPQYKGMKPVRITYNNQEEGRGSRDIYSNPDGFKPDEKKALENYDIKELPGTFNDIDFPIGTITRQPIAMGLKTVSSIYTSRALIILCSILEEIRKSDINVQDFLLFCFEGILLTASKMYKEQTRNIQSGTYYCPPIMREVFPFNLMDYKIDQAAKGVEEILQNVPNYKICISTEDAKELKNIPSDSIDYIFTDPPYSGKVQFGEANFVWETFLGFDTSYWKNEIIVSEPRGLSLDEWQYGLLKSLQVLFRVLKPGRYISLCYHDISTGTWELLQDIVAEAGFITADQEDQILFIEVPQKSHKQRVSDTVQKRDLVINFRKPYPHELSGQGDFFDVTDVVSFQQAARGVLVEALTKHPGNTTDHLYDELVSRLVRKRQFERHNFEELLRSLAEEISGRWYLLETAGQVDEAESKKEITAANHLEKFMQKYLHERPEALGVHYSDLFEQYLPIKDKPRRMLQDWLPEFFFKTSEGTWRPLDNDEERQQKAALRSSGALRRIKRFANALIDGVPPHDRDKPENAITMADWIRQCRRAGLYDFGRALYEKGGFRFDGLEERERVEVEEDYQVCVRRGETTSTGKKKLVKMKSEM